MILSATGLPIGSGRVRADEESGVCWMRIGGFEDIFYLTEFTVKKSSNEHSVCMFCGSVDSEAESTFFGRIGQDIQVIWEEREQDVCVFCGRVDNIQVSNLLHSSYIEVQATSFSAVEDEETKVRIWQNPAKKFEDILSKSKLSLSKCDLQLDKLLSSQQCEIPVLQNQETNFAFLRRISGYLDIPLWVNDTKKGKGCIVLAETLLDKTHTVESDDILRYKISKSQNGQSEIAITLRKYLPFGSKIRLPKESGVYVTNEMEIDLVHEVYEFSYKLKSYAPWKYQPPQIAHHEKTVYIKGTVENNKDEKNMGRIQVSFKESGIEEMDEDKMWIPYQSPYTGLAGGIVFLPDVGDKVNVVFSNEELYATAAVRENMLDEECRNVEEKYIGNNYKRRIFFREKEIKLASRDHTISMDDEKIELIVGESKITMTKDKILLQQGKTEFLIANKGGYLKTDGNEMVWNEEGIIGKSSKGIGLQSNGQINVSGNGEVNIEAKGSPLSLNGSVVNIG